VDGIAAKLVLARLSTPDRREMPPELREQLERQMFPPGTPIMRADIWDMLQQVYAAGYVDGETNGYEVGRVAGLHE
jgi:hypothetical protein